MSIMMDPLREMSMWWLVLACICACAAEKWRFPEGAASVRIDTKVHFVDGDDRANDNNDKSNENQVQADEIPFEPASNTAGFYNRPATGEISGRYPVRVESNRAPYRVEGQSIYTISKNPQNYYSDGTLDSLQHCKCVSTPDCNPSRDSVKACGVGKYLCCYKRPNKNYQQNSEFFNEVEDERPVLLPGQSNIAGPFPPPPDSNYNGIFGNVDRPRPQQAVLVGPDGPTGNIGPPIKQGPPPSLQNPQIPPVLVGPEGPTGIIGPAPGSQNPISDGPRDVGQSESAQRGILVGPGGPTGIIGPGGYNRRPNGFMNYYFGGGRGGGGGPGILVGPGGPTGIIGPGRGILVGPGGPTGQIGPRRPFYYGK
ncbi:uncharacterized protein ACR2FA_010366 [Aphomia sociella]